jgi:AcrR family transcriptional regulator
VSTLIRPVRTDAARNRVLLLAAAEAEFAAKGMSASIADIAVRAGVAKGTVFRHFATKEDLITEIVGSHFATLITVARDLMKSNDPGAALMEFMVAAADSLQQHDLAFLQEASEGSSTGIELRNRLQREVQCLVDRAIAAGAVRSDITGTDVLLLLCAPIHAVGSLVDPPAGLWRRYLVIVFDGLRPQGASPLPEPAPIWP